MDIDQIEPGEDFVEVINRKVGTCDIAIIAIGPHWLGATDTSGKRRLDDEEDFVRMEIVAALERNIRVIPVLVDGARMPGRHDLPEALAPLCRRNAIELSETRFHADVTGLIGAIEKSFAEAEKKAEAEAARLAEEGRQAAQLAELKLAEERKAAEAEAARLADEKRKREEAARVEAEKRKAAEAAERARLANEQRRRRDRPYSGAVRTQQDSVATPKDSTTPVELAQTTPATPPVPSTSWIAVIKDPKFWISERRILVGALVLLLVALAGFGINKAQHNRTLVARLNNPSMPGETQLGVFNEAEKKPTPPTTVPPTVNPGGAPVEANVPSRKDVGGNADGPIMGISDVKTKQTSDPEAETNLTLEIGIKKQPGAVIDHNKVKIEVFLYDIENNIDIKPTDADVSNEWLTPKHDWSDTNPEVLLVRYVRPKTGGALSELSQGWFTQEGESFVDIGQRKYLGYIVRVYYGSNLQAVQAEPSRPLQRIPRSKSPSAR